jgi:hypothetical protein
MPVILALRRLSQESHEFKASLGYIYIARPVSETKKNLSTFEVV